MTISITDLTNHFGGSKQKALAYAWKLVEQGKACFSDDWNSLHIK